MQRGVLLVLGAVLWVNVSVMAQDEPLPADLKSVRVMHVADDADFVDVYVNDELIWNDIPPNGLADYRTFAPDLLLVEVYPFNSGPGEAPLLTQVVDVGALPLSTLVFTRNDVRGLTIIPYDHELNTVNEDDGWLRIFNAVPGGAIQLTDIGTSSFDDLPPFTGASTVLEAGAYTPGWALADGRSVSQDIMLSPFQEILLVNSPVGDTPELVTFQTYLGVELRVLNALPSGDEIQLQLVNGPSATSVLSEDFAYYEYPIGDYAFELTVADAEPIPISTRFLPGMVHTWLVTDTDEVLTLQEPHHRFTRQLLTEGGNAMFRVFHLSPDTPPLDIISQDNAVLAENLSYGAQSATLEFPAGQYDWRLTLADRPEQTVVDLVQVDLEAATIYEIMIVGSFADIQTGQQDVEVFIRSAGCFRPGAC